MVPSGNLLALQVMFLVSVKATLGVTRKSASHRKGRGSPAGELLSAFD